MNSIKDQLDAAWTERNKLRSEGYKLYAEGYNLYAEGNKIWDEGLKLLDEGRNLLDEGHKLYTDGNNLWADKVAEVYGTEATIEWATTSCRVMNMEFKSTDWGGAGASAESGLNGVLGGT